MNRLTLASIVCVIAVVAFAAHAQHTAIAIVGQVLDLSGAGIPGAVVRLTSPEHRPRSSTTDANGSFKFDDVAPAHYEIEVSHPSFVAVKRVVSVRPQSPRALTVLVTLRPAPAAPEPPPASAAPAPAQKSAADEMPSARRIEPGTVMERGGRPATRAELRHSPPPRFNTEAYDRIEDNDFRSTRADPLSTFSIDVDTASYANVRRFLNQGNMPPPDAVRIEEMINYFRFDYPQPPPHLPFSVTTEITAAPWNPKHRLALIGLQARRLDDDRALQRNLVFLIDVSGSMRPDDKLPLIRKSMRMLVDTLTGRDRIAIVVYAGSSGLVLPTTPGDQKSRIHQAIAHLEAGGSTNGGAGIALAYKIAREQFVRGGINRVILATDGDFNVGVTNQGELIRLIEREREAGVFLSVLGVGTGNLKDSTMEKLADKGNGNYAYLDSLHEARKVLVAEAGATLVTVAKDVKIQVEFNPAQVAAYRLIGYENRLLRHEDFNNDRKDAGEIGAGHTVTALYEIVPPGAAPDLPGIDPLRYQSVPRPSPPTGRPGAAHELMTVKLRYKEPDGETSRLLAFPVGNRTTAPSANAGFAAAVAEFGMLLRSSEHRGSASYREAADLARRYRGRDEHGYRAELVRLIELAEAMSGLKQADTDARVSR